MRITNIDCFLVRLPYTPTMTRTTDKQGLFNAARSLNPTLDALLVRVETDSCERHSVLSASTPRCRRTFHL